MKSNELRIGNYILHEPTIDDWEEIIVTLPSLLQVDISSESYCGIPLTEEWLLRFGFEKLTEKGSGFKSTSYTYTGKVALIVHFDGVRLSVNFWQGNEKKYVHQLQNLYFALTGEELELKEKQDA